MEPLVSICCITYNHKEYIRDALDGFLSQRTDFPYEILINDDASTDGTADIIREYEQKYPEKIRALYRQRTSIPKGSPIPAGHLISQEYVGVMWPCARAMITGQTRRSCRSRWTTWKLIRIAAYAFTVPGSLRWTVRYRIRGCVRIQKAES